MRNRSQECLHHTLSATFPIPVSRTLQISLTPQAVHLSRSFPPRRSQCLDLHSTPPPGVFSGGRATRLVLLGDSEGRSVFGVLAELSLGCSDDFDGLGSPDPPNVGTSTELRPTIQARVVQFCVPIQDICALRRNAF